ncbi:MAG: acetoacetate--CoA ligase [Myxococcota bacterium]|nr:acetoacetate--CoA ligase [Myxococcota bacterium]
MEPLWRPEPGKAAGTQLEAFRARACELAGQALPDYSAFHAWSVREPDRFWAELWESCGVIGERGSERVLLDGDRLPGARWFPDARLSFAENLLRRRDAALAIVFRGEHGVRRTLSFAELADQVAALAASMRAAGLEPGDRVAAVMPNVPETVVALLAATSLGAIWSSCSPDFGTRGIVDRFGQIEPRWLFCADGYRYNGRAFDTLGRMPSLLRELPSVERTVVVPYLDDPSEARLAGLPGAVRYAELLAAEAGADLRFERLPFEHPLYLLYSSGTTGKPKCIVHSAGGALLKHLEEQRLHVDLRRDERLFYFTTCGWMMWNWLVGGLASEATLLLYDGSPFHPTPGALFDLAEQEGADVFGVSAKFIDSCAKSGVEPARSNDLSRVRTILSTGSPLVPESFDYVYQKVAPHAHLASISGGTDLLGCFVLGDPTAPVYRGEIQAPALGMQVETFGPDGRAVEGEPGELVCCNAFPTVPLGFWGDDDGARFRAAYFERFPGVWHHGDWMERTERGGFVIQGRSDAVLNPGGVRIGTAEIYRPVERLDEVIESIAIGQAWRGDVRIVLFVVLRADLELGDDLRERIRQAIRSGASPRHVPAQILQVPDIPRTRSGKLTELAVRDTVHGRPVANTEALANPEALEHFQNRRELAEQPE